jgi:hypothetical protein
MATQFIPTTKRDSIDLVYALHILMCEQMDEFHHPQ